MPFTIAMRNFFESAITAFIPARTQLRNPGREAFAEAPKNASAAQETVTTPASASSNEHVQVNAPDKPTYHKTPGALTFPPVEKRFLVLGAHQVVNTSFVVDRRRLWRSTHFQADREAGESSVQASVTQSLVHVTEHHAAPSTGTGLLLSPAASAAPILQPDDQHEGLAPLGAQPSSLLQMRGQAQNSGKEPAPVSLSSPGDEETEPEEVNASESIRFPEDVTAFPGGASDDDSLKSQTTLEGNTNTTHWRIDTALPNEDHNSAAAPPPPPPRSGSPDSRPDSAGVVVLPPPPTDDVDPSRAFRDCCSQLSAALADCYEEFEIHREDVRVALAAPLPFGAAGHGRAGLSSGQEPAGGRVLPDGPPDPHTPATAGPDGGPPRARLDACTDASRATGTDRALEPSTVPEPRAARPVQREADTSMLGTAPGGPARDAAAHDTTAPDPAAGEGGPCSSGPPAGAPPLLESSSAIRRTGSLPEHITRPSTSGLLTRDDGDGDIHDGDDDGPRVKPREAGVIGRPPPTPSPESPVPASAHPSRTHRLSPSAPVFVPSRPATPVGWPHHSASTTTTTTSSTTPQPFCAPKMQHTHFWFGAVPTPPLTPPPWGADAYSPMYDRTAAPAACVGYADPGPGTAVFVPFGQKRETPLNPRAAPFVPRRFLGTRESPDPYEFSDMVSHQF